jgi:[phosphatase 2A protein]-leucine-carboxy methyltransferase
VRTTAIDHLVKAFLLHETQTCRQVISLGAGSDTRFFRFRSDGLSASNLLSYHELDFSNVTAQKISIIHQNPLFSSLLGSSVEISSNRSSLTSNGYYIHACNLRELPTKHPAASSLPYWDPSLPTLIISECCLCYLQPPEADAALNHILHVLLHPQTPVGIVIYEPLHPETAFGRTMTRNLATRDITMPTLPLFPDIASQKSRLKALGLQSGQGAATVDWLWDNWIQDDEKERIQRLESLDEIEEWKLLGSHYGIFWAWRSSNMNTDSVDAFGGWRDNVVSQDRE